MNLGVIIHHGAMDRPISHPYGFRAMELVVMVALGFGACCCRWWLVS